MIATIDTRQSGFTLVEALVSVLILIVGLAAVTNLFLVGGTSNQTANHMSATTAEAQEVLEALKAIPFNNLLRGGNLAADVGAACQPDCLGNPDRCPTECIDGINGMAAGTFNFYRDVPGVGQIRTRWTIADPIPGAAGALCYISVRSESTAPLVGGHRSRAEFTTFRTCTTAGCPLDCP